LEDTGQVVVTAGLESAVRCPGLVHDVPLCSARRHVVDDRDLKAVRQLPRLGDAQPDCYPGHVDGFAA
jgi:hypothetical protein